MLFICICVHENMKKIPARPLLIDYGLAGMGLMLSRIDSGSAEVRLVFLLIDYGLAGMDYSLFSPPFLPLMEEKEQKKIKASGTPAKYMIEMIVHPAFIFHFSFFTSPLAR